MSTPINTPIGMQLGGGIIAQWYNNATIPQEPNRSFIAATGNAVGVTGLFSTTAGFGAGLGMANGLVNLGDEVSFTPISIPNLDMAHPTLSIVASGTVTQEDQIPAPEAHIQPQVVEVAVPSGGEFLLALITTPDRLEAILGDFESGFRRVARTHGEAKARQWYWWQTVRTGAALILPALVRMVGVSQLLHRIGIL
jgi:hypothetical protein